MDMLVTLSEDSHAIRKTFPDQIHGVSEIHHCAIEKMVNFGTFTSAASTDAGNRKVGTRIDAAGAHGFGS